MFITFEGIDGSGKSTQVHRAAGWLRTQGHDVQVVRDPGSTQVSERIRTLLLDADVQMCGRAELFLFAAARAQLVEERIRPALRRGAVVLSDRFYDSTTAYQHGARGVSTIEWMRDLHRESTNGLVPDRTYIIDVPVPVADARRHGSEGDRMEREATSFRERVRSAYHMIAQQDPDRVRLVEGDQNEEQVHIQVREDLAQLLSSTNVGTPQ